MIVRFKALVLFITIFAIIDVCLTLDSPARLERRGRFRFAQCFFSCVATFGEMQRKTCNDACWDFMDMKDTKKLKDEWERKKALNRFKKKMEATLKRTDAAERARLEKLRQKLEREWQRPEPGVEEGVAAEAEAEVEPQPQPQTEEASEPKQEVSEYANNVTGDESCLSTP